MVLIISSKPLCFPANYYKIEQKMKRLGKKKEIGKERRETNERTNINYNGCRHGLSVRGHETN